MTDTVLNLGALLYEGFEMLDLFGPLEMFSNVGDGRVRIVTVAESAGPVAASIGAEGPIGPQVVADFHFTDAPQLDILLVPGGFGTLPQLENTAMLDFLRERSAHASVVCSVCTGSALLARAGVLDGRRATSNKQFFALATGQPGDTDWVEQARWVEDDKFYTSSGVSAGMDMSLAVISRLFGADTAETVVKATEYSWHRDADEDPFASELNVMAQALGLA